MALATCLSWAFIIGIYPFIWWLFGFKTMNYYCLDVARRNNYEMYGEPYEPLEEPEFAMWLDLGEM